MNVILHVLTIATIRAEVGALLSSIISVCQTFMFLCTYIVLLVSALKIFYSSKSLSEYPSINPSNLAHYHDTSTLKYESEVFESPPSIAALTQILLIMSGDVELNPGPQENVKYLCTLCGKSFSFEALQCEKSW